SRRASIGAAVRRGAVAAAAGPGRAGAVQDDDVAVGWSGARKLRRAVDGLARVIAIEVLTAARALDLRAPLAPAPATAAVRDRLRAEVAGPGPDRHLAPEIEAAVQLVTSGEVLAAAERVIGPLR